MNRCLYMRSFSLSTMIDLDLMNTSGNPLTLLLNLSIHDTLNTVVSTIDSNLLDDNVVYCIRVALMHSLTNLISRVIMIIELISLLIFKNTYSAV